jgi:hypothetical protein
MNDYYDQRARLAENQQKIFNNRVKVILFLLAVGAGSLTIWEKCASLTHQSVYRIDSAKHARDSSIAGPGGTIRYPTTSSRKHHPKNNTSAIGQGDAQTGSMVSATEKDNFSTEVTPSQMAYPVQVVEAEDIELKLMSAKGNSHAQTITMTVVLTNHAANRSIWSEVKLISDPGGNEYVMKSFANGASTYDAHIQCGWRRE